MSPSPRHFLILTAVATLLAACDPNVVIGAKWRVDEGEVGAQAGSGGIPSAGGGGTGAGGSASGGTETGGTVGSSDGGAADAGAGGAGGAPALQEEWCATAPWRNAPVQFTSEAGNLIAPGSYVITYLSGAQIHDLDIGYEVTGHYFGKNALEAGHHVYSGASPESGATSLWLDSATVVPGKTVAEVESVNAGHTWPLEHAGGELFITLYDDDYHDNSGPGSRFCITAAAP